MSLAKYSPTVNSLYRKDQQWFVKNGGGFDNGINKNSEFDNDGFDQYGYNENNIDRAGFLEDHYESSIIILNEQDFHYPLYDKISEEWASFEIVSSSNNQLINIEEIKNKLIQIEEIKKETNLIEKKLNLMLYSIVNDHI